MKVAKVTEEWPGQTEQYMARVYNTATEIWKALNNLDENMPGYSNLLKAFNLLDKAIVEYEDWSGVDSDYFLKKV